MTVLPHKNEERRLAGFPLGGGETGALIRGLDWTSSPLGPAEQWSDILKGAVSLMLPSQAQIVLFWGPDFVALYNNAYASTIGNKHPRALGRPAKENWLELWDDLEPLLLRARSGETVVAKDRPFRIERRGYLETVYFDISYSPARNDRNDVEGVVCIVAETTDRVLAEQALRRANESTELALNASSGVGTWDWDIATNKVYADERFAKFFGVNPADAARGAPIEAFIAAIHPDDRERVWSQIADAIKTGERISTEYRLVDPDGNVRDVLARGHCVRDEQGRSVRLPGAVVDVTEKHTAEAALREAEDRSRLVLNLIDAGFCIVELKFGDDGHATDYCFLEVNPAFERTTGLKDAAGKWMRDLAPDHEQYWFDIYGEVARTGEPTRFENHAAAMGRWYDVHAFRIGDPSAHRVAILFNDITQRKSIEDALRASEAQLQILAQAMPNQVWTARPDGLLDWFNDRVYEYTGLRRGQLDGDRWRIIVHPGDLKVARERWVAAIESGETYQTEFRLRRHDGVYRWHIARSVPNWAADGTISRWIGTNTDVHDQKDAEAQLERRLEERTRKLTQTEDSLRQAQKMEAVGQLTGGIAHDFNNMLTGIIGSLDMLRRRIATGRHDNIDRFIDAATSSANRAASLTQRLLAFSRRQSLDLRPLDMGQLIDSMADLLRRTLGEQIELRLEKQNGLWPAYGDANQIETALLNFTINARDAMPKGGLLTVATGNVSLRDNDPQLPHGLAAGDYVVMRVSDTGMGMPRDVLARAFDPFFTTKPLGQGTGLGLSMAYGYAKQSRGHLSIESEIDAGTTVLLYLPRSNEAVSNIEAPSANAAPTGTGEIVLVVEDDDSVRLTVVEVLRELGYEAIEAIDGRAAIPILESRQRIDLLISDVGLPGLNGRQVAEIGRQHRANLKVLFITGYAENAAIRSGFLAPGMEMITKPFVLDELAAKIHEMIARA